MNEKVPTGVTSLLTQALIQREQIVAQEKSDGNVVPLPTSVREAAQVTVPQTEQNARNWASAVQLVEEARESIRIVEDQNEALEAQLSRVLNEAADAIGALQRQQKANTAEMTDLRDRLASAEVRADNAEKRAAEAEEWLCRLHDSIMNSLGRTANRPKAAPALQAPRTAIASS